MKRLPAVALSSVAVAALVAASPVRAETINVVASFSILADMVETVGGEHVAVKSIVGPNEDAHVYEPTPQDVVAVSEAAVVFVNGLTFEGFLERLIDASETAAMVATVTDGIRVIETDSAHDHAHDDEHSHDDHGHDDHAHDHAHDDHSHDDDHAHDHDHDHADHDHGPIDPHAWLSLDEGQVYVANIASALCDVAPDNCATFEANAAAYAGEMEALHAELEATVATIPTDQRIVITSHDAFAYLGRDFGFTFLSPVGVSTESEASAADVARIIEQVRATGASALFVENLADPRLLRQIADETGLDVSGTLYPGALSEADGPAASYLDLMRYNVTSIVNAIAGS